MTDARMTKWHRYFAWHPVRTNRDRTLWLTFVWRRCLWSFVGSDGYECEYRALDDPPSVVARAGEHKLSVVRSRQLSEPLSQDLR